MASNQLNALDWLCFALLIIGALNWGVIGIADINAIEAILEPIFQEDALEFVSRVIYIFVALAGLYVFYPLYRISNQGDERDTGL